MPSMSSTLFRAPLPHQAVTALLLVENSEAMSFIWPDLRDLYLHKLIDNLQSANPNTQVTVLVSETFPAQIQVHGLSPGTPRQHAGLQAGLQDLQFNYAPGNRITASMINNGIDFLTSFNFQGQPGALHLIVVAASTPSQESSEVNVALNHSLSPWYLLAQKLTKADIHCHMVLGPNQEMSLLSNLFDDTLRLQNCVEEFPPFPVDSNIQFRLSARPSQHMYSNAASTVPPFTSPLRRETPPRRNNSFPQDNRFSRPIHDPSPVSHSEVESPPSLVSQLQQVHGLTKKKVYGTKPARQPFFRDERVRDKYRKVPTPLTMPVSTSPISHQNLIPSPVGRVSSRSRADRLVRLSQASPTDAHSRRQVGWSRSRGSRLSSPEADGLSSPASTLHDMSPPTTYTSSNFSSPVSPTFGDDVYAMMGNCKVSQTTPTAAMPYENGNLGDHTWSQQPHPNQISNSPYLQSYYPMAPQPIYSEAVQLPMDTGIQPMAPHMPEPNSFQNVYTPMPTFETPAQIQETLASSNTGGGRLDDNISKPPKRSRSYAQDDERFSFAPEYVAATQVLFEKEVRPAYPNFPAMESVVSSGYSKPPSARGGFYFANENDSLPPSPSYQVGELYASRAREEGVHQPVGIGYTSQEPGALSYPASYSPGSSSSLTGWAG
ncbi:hypothetical protein BDQ12DRAFT_735464 [Crucibulum laeve]|uniref:Mediator of RNA polymerase II transcription subunit 25 n=1 Tax=Crucibulum laeve TaxID=68775 RepID=A0A5C3LYM2_9AGAR|nr:hypothetical protein BDQ12DRAFT_735464 [Crucibulum laeve]